MSASDGTDIDDTIINVGAIGRAVRQVFRASVLAAFAGLIGFVLAIERSIIHIFMAIEAAMRGIILSAADMLPTVMGAAVETTINEIEPLGLIAMPAAILIVLAGLWVFGLGFNVFFWRTD